MDNLVLESSDKEKKQPNVRKSSFYTASDQS